MFLTYIILLYFFTLIGGCTPLWSRRWNQQSTALLLAFSGTFLLGITLMHLIPENIHHNDRYAPLLIAMGFFLQILLQRLTHGLEHGHTHAAMPHARPVQWSLMLGLSIHAFSEGIPLGIAYHDDAVLPSLFFAIALHKLPESMLLTAMLMQSNYSKGRILLIAMLFSLVTPLAIILTKWVELSVGNVQNVFAWCLPVVAGSFLQISTTVLYESGTKQHQIRLSKWVVIIFGFILAFLTTFVTTTHQH